MGFEDLNFCIWREVDDLDSADVNAIAYRWHLSSLDTTARYVQLHGALHLRALLTCHTHVLFTCYYSPVPQSLISEICD